jgi:predicted GIY-YIG superfamily endonuclease
MKVNKIKIHIQDEIDTNTDSKLITKGQVYRIYNKNGMEYIGSTTNTLEKRFKLHISAFKRYITGKETSKSTVIKLFQNDFNSCIIEKLADVYFFKNGRKKPFLFKVENEYMKKSKVVNKNNAFITAEEKRAYLLKYLEDNKQSLRQKATLKINCDCGGKYTKAGKIQHLKTRRHKAYENSRHHANISITITNISGSKNIKLAI